MKEVLCLDLGVNSIGWALIDPSNNKVLKYGARIFSKDPIPRTRLRSIRRLQNRSAIQTTHIIDSFLTVLPLVCLVGAGLLAVFLDWQYWLNIAVAFLIAYLSLRKKS